MEIDITKIVPSDELNLDLKLIKSKLREKGEVVVFDNNQPQFRILSLDASENEKPQLATQDISDTSGMGIGQYVQKNMRQLFYSNILTENELANLTSADYSKRVFNISLPVLKKLDPTDPMDKQKRDAKGYNRYYSFILKTNSAEYLLCSQWLDRHRSNFEKWLSKYK